ncbi:hypothetical protein DPMN_106850 [Dreissena polymorpha]|uniref:Uncharacterized protein n=1 Tax=Dreissena polymorpha TaxID=45954 RepID=A0A9D4K5S0_DREPO|nr:hypothetical protein DPMN_106850 [Dreissena polymorpha]
MILVNIICRIDALYVNEFKEENLLLSRTLTLSKFLGEITMKSTSNPVFSEVNERERIPIP